MTKRNPVAAALGRRVSEAYTSAIERIPLVMSGGDALQRRPSPGVLWMALLGSSNHNGRIEENLHEGTL
jgi:hypothetical protein